MHNHIVYQIYPKSFLDTNDDGHGDIRGVIEKLDYLKDLGITMIWLTPIFRSPQKDNGYDVEDYFDIDPLYGSMTDVEHLIAEANKRNIDIMFDMVLNHTSTQHKWFQKALTGNKTYLDYYFFREKPTNWKSKFGGSAWQYVETLNLFYLHLFDKTQADLNWDNPKVFNELCRIVNFWLEKGIKGLRFDVINLISKPKIFEDDNEGDGRRFYTDGRNVHSALHALNKETFGRYKDVLTVGELSSTTLDHAVKYASPQREELGTIFGFHHLKVDYKDMQKWKLKEPDLIEFKTILSTWQEAMQENDALMALFLNNHDQPRSISRFGDDQNYPYQSATALATIMFLMRGIPTIYQGEEIGIPNAYFKTIDQYKDIESLNMYKDADSKEEALNILNHRSRDNGRTPMPWNHDKYYGFSKHEPWLEFSNHPHLKTVLDNLEDSSSIYYFYQKLIALRQQSKTLKQGTITFSDVNHPTRFVYTRTHDDETIKVISNLSRNIDRIDNTVGEILLSNTGRSTLQSPLILQPFEVIVIKV